RRRTSPSLPWPWCFLQAPSYHEVARNGSEEASGGDGHGDGVFAAAYDVDVRLAGDVRARVIDAQLRRRGAVQRDQLVSDDEAGLRAGRSVEDPADDEAARAAVPQDAGAHGFVAVAELRAGLEPHGLVRVVEGDPEAAPQAAAEQARGL